MVLVHVDMFVLMERQATDGATTTYVISGRSRKGDSESFRHPLRMMASLFITLVLSRRRPAERLAEILEGRSSVCQQGRCK
jgi:hypothetical protein